MKVWIISFWREAMNTNEVITLARKHLMAASSGTYPVAYRSAQLCLADALTLYELGAYYRATERAVKSLAYTVGCFHPDYVRAAQEPAQ
jgi:hypothetical protein